MKTEYAWVIQRDDGKYWLGGFYGKDNVGTLSQAKIYQEYKKAYRLAYTINDKYPINVKVVKVELKVVEDGEV